MLGREIETLILESRLTYCTSPGVDISKIPLDQKLTEADSKEANSVTSMMAAFATVSKDIPEWTPRVVAEKASIGGLGPVAVGSPSTVADEIERWIDEADLDGFNIGLSISL